MCPSRLGMSLQQMRVKWGSALSDGFGVSNGVRQGSVLSPVLFAVYLDGLLVELSSSGVGCYWACMFAGSFCYADDVVLLAPCAGPYLVGGQGGQLPPPP